jgi:Rrf2 family iron-sulfur cluster assembly transcriptional regulator
MKLTTKGRYAVTAMLDVALHTQEGPVSLAEVARRQKLSLSYLEQLFSRLRRQGLVTSSRRDQRGGHHRCSGRAG